MGRLRCRAWGLAGVVLVLAVSRWAATRPGRGRPVVLYGASAGAEAVLLLASYLPHLADGVVANSPSAVVTYA